MINLKEKNISLDILKKVTGNNTYKFSEKIQDNTLNATGFGIYQDDESYRCRYYLYINLCNDRKKTLTAILMNPSNTFPDTGFDPTVKNVIRIAKATGYSEVVVLNTSALIQGNGEKAPQDYDSKNNYEEINRKFISKILEYCDDLLIAWGGKPFDRKYYIEAAKNVKNLWAYKWASRHYPCHPSQQVDNHYKYVQEFLSNPEKSITMLEVKDNKLCKIEK